MVSTIEIECFIRENNVLLCIEKPSEKDYHGKETVMINILIYIWNIVVTFAPGAIVYLVSLWAFRIGTSPKTHKKISRLWISIAMMIGTVLLCWAYCTWVLDLLRIST